MAKASQSAGTFVAIQLGKVPKERVTATVEMARGRGEDLFVASKGVPVELVMIMLHKHGLKESDEVKEIIAKAKQKVQQTIKKVIDKLKDQKTTKAQQSPAEQQQE